MASQTAAGDETEGGAEQWGQGSLLDSQIHLSSGAAIFKTMIEDMVMLCYMPGRLVCVPFGTCWCGGGWWPTVGSQTNIYTRTFQQLFCHCPGNMVSSILLSLPQLNSE